MLPSSLHSKKANTVETVSNAVYIDESQARLASVPRRIGLIAGEGNFPITLAQAAHSEGVEIVVFGIQGYASDALRPYASQFYMLRLTEVSRLIELSHRHEVKHLVMAGRIPHGILLLKQISMDARLLKILATLPNKKADSLLKRAVDELEREGLKVIDSTMFLKSCMPEAGLLTPRCRPTEEVLKDIEFGYPLAKEMGRLDIGQTIAVKNQVVIAVEALEGTDNLIKRSYDLAGEGVVFVKVSKPRQDMRFDVPVVGITTIRNLAQVQAAALCVTANRSLFFDRKEAVDLAEKHRIAIVARLDDGSVFDEAPAAK